jgi:hypothetical protein
MFLSWFDSMFIPLVVRGLFRPPPFSGAVIE